MRFVCRCLLLFSLSLYVVLSAEEEVHALTTAEKEVESAEKKTITTKEMVDKMIAARNAEKKDDFEEAEHLLEELHSYSPQSPLIRERLNRVRSVLGKPPLPEMVDEDSELETVPATEEKAAVTVDKEEVPLSPLDDHSLPKVQASEPFAELDKQFPSAVDSTEETSEELVGSKKNISANDYSGDEQSNHAATKRRNDFSDLQAVVAKAQTATAVEEESSEKTFVVQDGEHEQKGWTSESSFRSDSLSNIFEDLRKNVISLENSHHSLQLDINFLESENSQIRDSLHKTLATVKEKENRIQEIEQEYESLTEQHKALQNDLEKENEKNNYLKERLRTVLQDKDKLQRKLSVVLADSRVYDNVTSSVERLANFEEEVQSKNRVNHNSLDTVMEAQMLWREYLEMAEQSSNPDDLEESLFAAANAGSGEAMMEIVRLRERGKILAYNTRPIFEWILLAAKHGNTDAMEKLGDLFAEGDFYVSQNPVEAFAWYEVASFRDNMNVVPKLRTLESELIRSGKKNLLTDGRILANEILAYIK